MNQDHGHSHSSSANGQTAQSHANGSEISDGKHAASESHDRDTALRADTQHPRQVAEEEGSKTRRPRGFAAMDPKLVSELAKRGGKAAHRAGTAHQFNSEEARVAGRKGGQATHAKRRAKSTTASVTH